MVVAVPGGTKRYVDSYQIPTMLGQQITVTKLCLSTM